MHYSFLGFRERDGQFLKHYWELLSREDMAEESDVQSLGTWSDDPGRRG